MTNAPPYPADLEAKGWSLDLDYERIEQSDTWAVASFDQRPWLLMLWLVSWRQVPVASLPNDGRLIAARLGMSQPQFEAWRDVLMSGWELASDGRFYHKTLTDHVLRMANKRDKDRARVAAYRARSSGLEASNACVTRDSSVSSTPTPTPTPTPEPKDQEQPLTPSGVVGVVIDAYHEVLPKCQQCRVKSPKRSKRIAHVDKLARKLSEEQGWDYDPRQFWLAYFGECALDPWMRGEVPHPGRPSWKQNLDCLLDEDRFATIMDRAIAAMQDDAR